MRFTDAHYNGWVCDSTCVGMGKLSSTAGKAPHLKIWIGQICTSQAPCLECAPNMILQRSKTSGWDYYLGAASMNSVCQHLCVGCCQPLPPSLSQSDSQWLSSIESPAIPVVWDQSRGSYKVTPMPGALVAPPPESSFSAGRTERLGEGLSVWRCTGLGEERCS